MASQMATAALAPALAVPVPAPAKQYERLVAHVLLQWFVSKNETEAPGSIGIDGFLQVQSIEWNRLLYWFRARLLDNREMKLVIYKPVIGHVEKV